MDICLTINGEERPLEIHAGETLLEVLRRLGYVGVKHGCEDGSCGVCTVLLDGKAVHSCVMLAAQADGRRLTTIEGLGRRDHLHPLQTAFVEHGAVQCGYCTPAMILSAKALLDENPHPTEAQVRAALSGVLCRCTGYLKPVEAVLSVAEQGNGGA
jgi:aerobic-type carbon monoxide dehydrogenase small subunit (CoxS/CutS family)